MTITKNALKTTLAVTVMVIVIVGGVANGADEASGNAAGVTGECPKDTYCLSVPIPIPGEATKTQIKDPAEYIKIIYRFSLGIGALLAVAMIVFGGIEYTVSAGNVSKQQEARDRILNAVYGLALLMAAVLILFTINPNLVKVGLPTPQTITPPTTPSVPPTTAITKSRQSYLDTQSNFSSIIDRRNKFIKDHNIGGNTDGTDVRSYTGWGGLTPDQKQELAQLNCDYFSASRDTIVSELELNLAVIESMVNNDSGLLAVIRESAANNNCNEFDAEVYSENPNTALAKQACNLYRLTNERAQLLGNPDWGANHNADVACIVSKEFQPHGGR